MQPETAPEIGPETAPETALNSWRQWTTELRTRPVILEPLNGGRSNRSFLLESGDNRMVLRLNGTDSILPDSNRNKEIDIWEAASKQGIAPRLLHMDVRNRFLVSTYIYNKLPSKPQFIEAFVDQAFELLDRCHQLDVNAPVIDYGSHIEHYWQIIEAKYLPPNQALHKQRKPMQFMLETLINSDTPTGLCHHDPVIANFVGSADHLYLIDWEYAAHGLQIMDYAALVTEWKIDDKTVLIRTGFKPESLQMAKALYKYLCELWEEVTSLEQA